MSGVENVSQWKGQDIVGSDGDKIGKLEDVYIDTETGQPVFGAVQIGMIGKHRWAFVPLDGASVGQDHLQVNADKKQVKDAPSIDPKGELAKQQEEDIYDYYGMTYQAPSGASGRRLARR